MATYWKTWHEGKTRTHLDGIADSHTLCGVDTAGDDLVHDRNPEELRGKHRVTCGDCQRIIATVREHLGKSNARAMTPATETDHGK